MTVHIALSLLVYYTVRYGQARFYFYALLAHTLLNFGAVMISQQTNGMWLSELYILVLAVLSLVLIFRTGEVEARLAGPLSPEPLPAAPPPG